MISFGVVTYNQEQYILEHLESLKYQIETYGQTEKIQLVIADDGSQDSTLHLVSCWLKKNDALFDKVDIVCDGQNHGTCENVARMYEHIYGDRFITLAGDDLYSYENIFELFELLDDFDIVCGLSYSFNDQIGILLEEQENYSERLRRAFYKPYMMRCLSIMQCPVEGPGSVFKTSYLNSEMLNIMRRFYLIDDQPRIYYMYKYHKIKKYYVNKAYVLYRIHKNSVSHSNKASSIGKLRETDEKKLCQFYIQNEHNPFYKFIAWIRLQSLQGHNKWRYVNPLIYILKLQEIKYRSDRRVMYEKMIQRTFGRASEHLAYIIRCAKAVRLEIRTGEMKNELSVN